MADSEDKIENVSNFGVTKLIVGVSGFVLSIIFLLFAMIVLVRFWIFTNLLYNLFVISRSNLIVGLMQFLIDYFTIF